MNWTCCTHFEIKWYEDLWDVSDIIIKILNMIFCLWMKCQGFSARVDFES